MPELLWKAYIDFEIEEGEREIARGLYERLIQLSGHVKVWISYALFEAEPIPIPRALREDEDEDEEAEVRVVEGDAGLARQVFERGYKDMKSKGLKSEVRISFLMRGQGTNIYCSVLLYSRSGKLSRKAMGQRTT
jgi:crooked neck